MPPHSRPSPYGYRPQPDLVRQTTLQRIDSPRGHLMVRWDWWLTVPGLICQRVPGTATRAAQAAAGALLALAVLVVNSQHGKLSAAQRRGTSMHRSNSGWQKRSDATGYQHRLPQDTGYYRASAATNRKAWRALRCLLLEAELLELMPDGRTLRGLAPEVWKACQVPLGAERGPLALPLQRDGLSDLIRRIANGDPHRELSATVVSRRLWQTIDVIARTDDDGLVHDSERDLARRWGCSAGTAGEVLRHLVACGVLADPEQLRGNDYIGHDLATRRVRLRGLTRLAERVTGRVYDETSTTTADGQCSAVPGRRAPHRPATGTRSDADDGSCFQNSSGSFGRAPASGATQTSGGRPAPTPGWICGPATTHAGWTRDCVERWPYNRLAIDSLLDLFEGRVEGQATREALRRGRDLTDDALSRFAAGEQLNDDERDGVDTFARLARVADLLLRLGMGRATEHALVAEDPIAESGSASLDPHGRLRPSVAARLVSARLRPQIAAARAHPDYLASTGRSRHRGTGASRVADSSSSVHAVVQQLAEGLRLR